MTVRPRVSGLVPRTLPEPAEIVAISSVADPRQSPAEECARAATSVADAFRGEWFRG